MGHVKKKVIIIFIINMQVSEKSTNEIQKLHGVNIFHVIQLKLR